MKKINRIALCLTICASMALPSITYADSVLEYLVKENRVSAATTQSIAIKNDQIMVKAAGGDKNLDLLYRHTAESVVIIDHRKGTLMTVDEQQVDRINQQTQNVQPLLQGLGEQIAKLSPDQRQNLQKLLGDNASLDMIAKAAEPPAPTRLVPAGVREVSGIRCQTMRVMQGATPMAELCLAEQAAIKIPDNDYTTLRALLALYEKLANKSQKLARQIGLAVPTLAMSKVKGVPIQLRDLSRDEHGTATLRRIKTDPVQPGLMSIPGGYATKPLTLWQ